MMKKIIYKIVYNQYINRLIRFFALPIYKLTGKKIISISGLLRLKLDQRNMVLKIKTNQTCSSTQDIFYNGAENYEFTKLFVELIADVDTFFDIGANIGYFSILAAKINPSVTVYSFEPSLGPVEYLEENIKINGLQNRVKVVRKAVSNVDGVLTFHNVVSLKYPWIEHSLNGSHSLQNNFGRVKEKSYSVPVTSLSNFKIEQEITKVNFLKLDTECTEHLILDSAIDLINMDRPLIICEIYDEIKNEIDTVLKKFKNYQIFQINNDCLYSMNSILDEIVYVKDANYLFCPSEKLDKIQKFIR